MKMLSLLRHIKNSSFLKPLAVLGVFLALIIFLASPMPKHASAAGVESGPRIWLHEPHGLAVTHKGQPKLLANLASRQAESLSLVSGDFDEDGVADLIVGYGAPGGGLLALHPGNLDAIAPQTTESWQAIAAGNFPPAFLDSATVSSLPARPDFMAAGKLTGTGHTDLLIATRGSNVLHVLAGDGHGHFGAPQAITLPGSVTALAAGGFGAHSPFARVLVGVTGPRQGSLLLYSGSARGLVLVGNFAAPAAASAIVLGDLDGDNLPDAAIVAGGQTLVLHSASAKGQPALETLSLPVAASSIALGRFVFDRDPRLQMALLAPNGSVHIVAHSGFDSHFWTADELQAMQKLRTRPNLLRRTAPSNEGWVVVESLAEVAPFTDNLHPPLLLPLRISGHGEDDVVVLNQEAGQMAVVSRPGSRLGDKSFLPAQLSLRPYTGGSPVAVTAMRVNADGRKGMVVLHRGQIAPSVMEPLPDPTFVVNTTADTVDINPGDGKCADAQGNCSLRAAIMETNAEAGVDTIVVPAGTFTLTIPDNGLNNASGGHLDITDGVNVVGAGTGLTIVQAGTASTNGIDKVFSINPNGASASFDALLSNMTIQFGRNTSSSSPFGGAFDWDAGTNGTGNLTLSSCNINHNSIVSSTAGFSDGGGALFSNIVGGTNGTVTITNSTIQNNSAQDGGGGLWVGSTVPLAISNTQVLNNQAVGGGAQTGGGILVFGPSGASQSAIHGSTISGNVAGSQGGGIYTTEGLLIDQGGVISGNQSSGDGGGLWSNVTNETTTVTNTTITSNSATGSGGGIEVDSNTIGNNLTMSFSRIVGNTAVTGSGINNLAGTVAATENWWGCNAGPTVAPCDLVAGGVTFSPWITMSHVANPSAVANGGSTTLTASFLQDSGGGSIPASNLGVLIGLPITFGNAVNGTLSNAQTTIQANGTATATFTTTAGGTSHADATVDHATVTANVTVSSFTITITPATQTVLAGTSTTYNVTVAPVNGFNGPVTLAVSGCPSNATCTLSSTSIPGASGTSTLTVVTTAGITAANDTLTVTGTSGSTVVSATATLGVQDFTMNVTPASQNVNVGSSTTYTVTVSRLNGFTGIVTPSASGLPAGASATFNPTTIGGRVTASTMTVSTSGATPAANSTLTISGSSGGQSRTTTATLSVKDFSVSVSPASRTINAGASTTYTVTVTPSNGFTGSVTLSVSGLPSGASGSFNPNPVTITSGAVTSILTVTTSSTTPAANSTPTITGNVGTLSHGTSVTLSVQDFSVTPTPPSCIIAGSSATIPISLAPLNGFTGSASLSVSGLPTGASGSFNPNPVTISGTVTSTLTVTTSASTPGGNYPLSITVTSGGVTHTSVVTLCVENFTLTISPASRNVNAGASTNYTVTVTPVNGFTGVVGLSQIGLPSGATPSFSPSSITITGTSGVSSTLTVSTTNALAGAVYPFTVSGTAGSLTQSVSASLSVQNFTLSIAPSSQTILVGGSATYTVTATPVNGYTGTLNCSVTGLPAGATANCPAITITSTSGSVPATLTITTTTSTPPVNVVLTVTYTDTSGAPSHSVTPGLSTQNFTCSVSPNFQQVVAGSSIPYTVTVAPLNGFNSPVNFSVSGLPSGASGSFNPNPLNGGSGTSTLTVNTSTSTPLANAPLTISCSSGPITQQVGVTLQVVAIQVIRPTTFTAGCFCADYTNAANAIDGNLATFASGPAPSGTGAFTADNYSGFGSPSRPPLAINLKVSSAFNVGNGGADMVTMDYSTDGGSTLHSIYDVFGTQGGGSRGQQTDVVSLPVNTNLANVMVDASVNNGGTSTHTIYEIWIEVIHQ